MCGIAGVMYADAGRVVAPDVATRMGHVLAHRGPDGQGVWRRPGIALVHRRLAIIDLAGGDQPIGNEDGSIQVVFNGEIYNYRELRGELEHHGHRFRTRSDTEVLVHLYEEHGDRLVNRLRGMFAFALWDQSRQRLLLARDRLGIKPVYFYRDAEKTVFGSELKSVLAHPDVPREADPAALEDYFAFGMIPGSRCIFSGTAKLAAAHTLGIERSNWNASPVRYWQLNLAPDERTSLADWQEAVRAKVEEAVRTHLVADVPVGAFLSGGVDSSVVVACAARSQPLQTFAIGFNEEQFSELPHARMVAHRFGTQQREEIVTPDAAALLDELVDHFDEPFADSSAVPTFLLARLASQHVKVVLSGDGGDEAFGGYARYVHDLREDAIRQSLPGVLRRRLLGPLGRLWPKADWLPRSLRAKTTLTNLSLDPASAYANTLTVCRSPLRRRLLAAEVAARLNGHQPGDVVRACFASAPAGDTLAGMLAADVGVLLTDDFLVKVDRASMAHGLEVRPPLLDHELLELAARIPSRWKVHGRQTKYVFKQAFRNVLPAEILNKPKQGFEVPIDAWLRGPLRSLFEDAVLNNLSSPSAALLNRQAAARLFRAHLSGAGRHGAVLWSLLVLARWADRYLKCCVPT